MSRFRKMSGAGWFFAGLAVAVLVAPSVAVAAALSFTGIQGASGNKADVTAAHQLLTAPVSPGSMFQSDENNVFKTEFPIAVPPKGSALVITYLHVDNPETTPNTDAFTIETGSKCTGTRVGIWEFYVNSAAVGDTTIPFSPGLVIPSGDALCAIANGDNGSAASASGYTVPASSVK